MNDSSSVRPPRPLSPHLQIYKPQITSVMSILHRITGIFLFIGTLVIALWLWFAAYDQEAFGCLHVMLNSLPGTLGMIGWTGSFFYHLFNGVRHLFWDMGKGFDLEEVTLTGISAIAFTLIATLAIWWLLLGAGI